MPPASSYNPDSMSAEKKFEFERWYANKVHNNYTFHLKRDMEAYCISDVKLLKAGCQKFQEQFKQKASFNPMEKCYTIASSCHRFWCKKLLTPDTIASEPPGGWHGAQSNQSAKAFNWLAWQEHLRCHSPNHDEPRADHMKHANNGGEQRVANVLVDGLDVHNNTVYQFHGCLWHGCPRCFPRQRDRYPICHTDRTLEEVYEHTLKKQALLKQHGYHLKIMWECD